MNLGVLPASATYSKDSRFWSSDPYWHPKRIVQGAGAHVLGDDAVWYLDWTSSLGALCLGHGHQGFTERVCDQVRQGVAYGLSDVREESVAEKLVAVLGTRIPGWSTEGLQVRWVIGGSEACAAAVTLARTATKRNTVVSIGYHGWHAMFTGLTSPALGVLPDRAMINVSYGDIAVLGALLSNKRNPVAAVIIEQIAEEAPDGYWQDIRRLCDNHGTLLIIDEVVTGFRLAVAGAAEFYGVRPDIAIYGKALANGLPLGAVVASREYMQLFEPPTPVFVSATGAANPVCLAAADCVLDIWDQTCVENLWAIGSSLMVGLREVGYTVVGVPPRSLIQFASNAERGYFIVGMRDRGILMNRPNLPCLAHTMIDVERTIRAAHEIKQEMGTVDVATVMAGREPAVLFANR